MIMTFLKQSAQCRCTMVINVVGWEAEMRMILLILLLVLVYSLPAQVLDISESETFIYTSSTTPKLYSTITNLTDEKQTFVIRRKDLELPDGWESYFCFNSCFPPFMSEATVSLEPGESENLQVDYTIDEEVSSSGVGIVQYEIQLENDPDDVYVRTYGVSFRSSVEKSPFEFHVKKAALVTPLNEGGGHNFTLENTSDEDLEVTVRWNWVTKMKEWELSVCLDNCFPPVVTSTDLTIKADETKELLIHVTPGDSGVGVVEYSVGLQGEAPTASLLFAYPTIGKEAILQKNRTTARPLVVQRMGAVFTITLPEAAQSSVLLYNSLGREVAQLFKGVSNGRIQTVAIPTLASGVYLLRVRSGLATYSVPVQL